MNTDLDAQQESGEIREGDRVRCIMPGYFAYGIIGTVVSVSDVDASVTYETSPGHHLLCFRNELEIVERASLTQPQVPSGEGEAWRPTHRHIKTGGLYQTLDVVTNATNEQSGQRMTLYRNREGRHFVRERSEFEDGRFERLDGYPMGAPPGTVSTLPRQSVDVPEDLRSREAYTRRELDEFADDIELRLTNTAGHLKVPRFVLRDIAQALRSLAEQRAPLLARSDAAPDAVGATTLTQSDILTIVAEEGGEIVQAATKCLRFGWDRDWPGYGVNHEKLAGEVGDLLGMLDALPIDWSIVAGHRAGKLAKAGHAKATIGAALARAETSQGQGGQDNG